MTTAIVCFALVAAVAIIAAVAITHELVELLNAQEDRHAEERHTLTNRVQAPTLVPVSGSRTQGPRPQPPSDAEAYGRIGTVTHVKPDGNA